MDIRLVRFDCAAAPDTLHFLKEAGRIGYTTMQCLSGFHPKKIYAYDPYPNDRVLEYAQFVPLPELYEKSPA